MFNLVCQSRETLPAVMRGMKDTPDTSPVRLGAFGAIEWGALHAANWVNGCGPTSWPDLIPDLTPAISARGYVHDIRYLVGGTEEDRQRADAEFAQGTPGIYADAVKKHGSAFFCYREKPLTHGELCALIHAAFLVEGYAACAKQMPDDRVLREIERLSATGW